MSGLETLGIVLQRPPSDQLRSRDGVTPRGHLSGQVSRHPSPRECLARRRAFGKAREALCVGEPPHGHLTRESLPTSPRNAAIAARALQEEARFLTDSQAKGSLAANDPDCCEVELEKSPAGEAPEIPPKLPEHDGGVDDSKALVSAMHLVSKSDMRLIGIEFSKQNDAMKLEQSQQFATIGRDVQFFGVLSAPRATRR